MPLIPARWVPTVADVGDALLGLATRSRSDIHRRFIVGCLALGVVAGCGLAGPDPAPSVLTGPTTTTPDSGTPGTDRFPAAAEPYFGRQQIAAVEAYRERTTLAEHEVLTSAYDGSVAGDRFGALWDPAGSGAVRIVELSTGREVVTYRAEGELRYVGWVRFRDDVALLADVPMYDQIEAGGPARLIRIDLTTGDVSDILPPAGTAWTVWPGQLVETDSGFAWVARRSDRSGDCAVAIDDERTRVLACWEGEYAAFMARSTGGVTALLFPAGENIVDCRRRVFVPLDGADQVLLGGDDSCRAYDGVVHERWHVWSQVGPSAPALLSRSALLADGPDGEQLAFGWIVTGTLTQCGDHVYWYAEQSSGADPDGVVHLLRRWRPGMPAAETIDTDRPGDYWSGGTACSGRTVTTNETLHTPTSTWSFTYYFRD